MLRVVVLQLLSLFWFQKKWNETVLLKFLGFLTQNRQAVLWRDWVLQETGKSLEMSFRRGICGSFFFWLSFSPSQVVIKKSSDDKFFVKDYDIMIFFHSNSFFERKKLTIDNFLMTKWEQEIERKKESEIPRQCIKMYELRLGLKTTQSCSLK